MSELYQQAKSQLGLGNILDMVGWGVKEAEERHAEEASELCSSLHAPMHSGISNKSTKKQKASQPS